MGGSKPDPTLGKKNLQQNAHQAEADTAWPAPQITAEPGATASVAIPGSKSLTNRYLILAALASSPSRLYSLLNSRDSALMIKALESLGASFTPLGSSTDSQLNLEVTPLSRERPAQNKQIDVGLAGTVMRFVPALAALIPGSYHFDGDPHARQRPMAPVIEALKSLGISIEDQGRASLPFSLHSSGRVRGGPLELDASASSQFVSALLLAGCHFDRGLDLSHVGSSLPSLPHIQMTIQTLAEVGVSVQKPGPDRWLLEPASYPGFEVTVEPDLSNAGPFLAAALVLGVSVSIPGWPQKTSQVGAHWLEILPRFGARVHYEQQSLTVTGPPGGVGAGLPGVDLDLSEAGELAPTVAALCALASSPSRLSGISHLRGHETNRLAALTQEINRLGGSAQETADGIRISSPVSRGTLMRTYQDHRMATAAAIIGLSLPGVEIENVATTGKTLPNFTGLWQTMLDDLQKSQKHA